MQITLRDDVYDWIVQSVGWGDRKFWNNPETLEFHITNCVGRNRCGVETFPCRSEDWGYTALPGRIICFIFRNPNHAMLFKLAWGGE